MKKFPILSKLLRLKNDMDAEIDSLNDKIDRLDPEAPSAIFSDVNFSIAVADWTLDSQTGLYNATVTNTTLLTATAGIQVFYDDSFRTALSGDIYVNKSTGYVTFTTTAAPTGTLTGFLRIMDSTTGIVPVHRGGTGAATPRQARENLNTPIRDIFVDFGTVSSLPQTVYDADLRANMVAFDAVFSNPDAIPGGIDVTFADPSGNVNGSVTITGTISGSTTISFYAHEKRTAVEGSETASETQRVQDFVQTNAQTLTAAQKTQVLSNIGGASAEAVTALSDSFGKVISTSSSDGVKTFAQVFNALFAGVDIPLSKTYIKHSSGRIFRCYNENAKEFIQLDGFDVGYANLLIRVITASGYYEASNTLTFTNYSSSVVASGQTWSLITYG